MSLLFSELAEVIKKDYFGNLYNTTGIKHTPFNAKEAWDVVRKGSQGSAIPGHHAPVSQSWYNREVLRREIEDSK